MSDVLAQLQRPFQSEINFQYIFPVDEIKRKPHTTFASGRTKQGKRRLVGKNSDEHRSKAVEENGELFHGGGGSVFVGERTIPERMTNIKTIEAQAAGFEGAFFKIKMTINGLRGACANKPHRYL